MLEEFTAISSVEGNNGNESCTSQHLIGGTNVDADWIQDYGLEHEISPECKKSIFPALYDVTYNIRHCSRC